VVVRFLAVYDRPADPAAFERHLREVHLPLVRLLPGLRRLSVSGPTAAVQGEPVQHVTELEWDDLASLSAAFASPEGRGMAADATELGAGGVRSAVYEVEDLL
jgi:uncharacterized protein (TIGR02118 family)